MSHNSTANSYSSIRQEIYNDNLKLEEKIQKARKYEEEFFLKLLYAHFIKLKDINVLKDDKAYFDINMHFLAMVVKSMLDDIHRFVIYSHSKQVEKPKYSAYLIRWISRIKPIQVTNQEISSKHLHFINSYFSIFVGLSLLELKDYDSIQVVELYEELRYATYYRDISPKDLTLLLRTIKKNDI